MGANDPPEKWVLKGVIEFVMTNFALAFLSAGFGAGLAVLGAGIGIGRLAAAAMDGTARQPAATGDIRTTRIIAAALIEVAPLFAIVVCIILAVKGVWAVWSRCGWAPPHRSLPQASNQGVENDQLPNLCGQRVHRGSTRPHFLDPRDIRSGGFGSAREGLEADPGSGG